MKFLDSTGNVLVLGDQIARGGEGSVHKLQGRSDVVAKVYHQRPTQDRQLKLKAMVALQSGDLLKLACWPTDVLREQANGTVVGFIMPIAVGHKEAFKLYNPKSRQAEFKDVTWRFLLHVATNIARAFATVHRSGHIIGDVNHSSVMIGPDATVKLIDCDSFQVTVDSRRFACEVGESLHTPPELQGKISLE